jgi:transposase
MLRCSTSCPRTHAYGDHLTMLGPAKRRELDHPVTVSLDELVPGDHFYRHLDACLDLSFVRDWVRDAYPTIGRPSIDPVIFFKLYLVLVFEGLRSERQLLMLAADRLSVRWYLRYSLDESLPDASALTRLRQRVGLPLFRRFFEHVVDLCVEAGLVWGQELLADATRVPANAAMDSLVPRLRLVVDDEVVALFDGDAVPTEGDGDDVADAPRWDVLEECRLDPERPATGTYERISRRKISRTDPDATPMNMRDGRTVLGYQDHYLIDGGRARIIWHAFVTPGDVSESQVLIDQLRRTLFRRQLRPQRLIADAKYGTARNVRAIEELGIRAYVPLHEGDASSLFYRHTQFTHDAEQDVYYCPQGSVLKFRHRDDTAERWLYRANASVCNACSCKSACTSSSQGRLVGRSFHAEYLERVRSYYDTPAYQKAMRKRSVWVEPLFAEAKDWHGLRRFRLRGLVNVNIEALVVATGQHLKRWLGATGWGRRWGPAGCLTTPSGRYSLASLAAAITC